MPIALVAALLAIASPPSRAAAVASVLGGIERNLTSTNDQHRLAADARNGVYRWDCSIMAAWILERSAPAARRARAAAKPLARDFHRTIARAPADRIEHGWQRLTDVAALAPGDVFGTATIAFQVDAAGAPRAYGWYGAAQDPTTYVPTSIAFGRVFR